MNDQRSTQPPPHPNTEMGGHHLAHTLSRSEVPKSEPTPSMGDLRVMAAEVTAMCGRIESRVYLLSARIMGEHPRVQNDVMENTENEPHLLALIHELRASRDLLDSCDRVLNSLDEVL